MYEETTSESLGVRWIMSSLLIIFLARRWKMLTLLISNTSSKTFLSPGLSVDNLLNTNSIASSFFWIFIKTPLGHLHTIAGKSTNIPLPSIRKRKASTQNNKKHWSEFFGNIKEIRRGEDHLVIWKDKLLIALTQKTIPMWIFTLGHFFDFLTNFHSYQWVLEVDINHHFSC